jgi:hypothetical protein
MNRGMLNRGEGFIKKGVYYNNTFLRQKIKGGLFERA